MLTQSGNLIKGSTRSTSDINIGSIINNAVTKKILVNGGGHDMAAGFSLYKKDFNKFKNFLFEYNFTKININKKYVSKISASAINLKFLEDLDKLAPFGNNNKRPIFFVENLKIINSRIIDNLHIHCLLKDKKNKIFDSILFNSVNTNLGNCLLNYKKEINILCKFNLYGANNNKISTHIIDIVT